jgi:hypothetical protein
MRLSLAALAHGTSRARKCPGKVLEAGGCSILSLPTEFVCWKGVGYCTTGFVYLLGLLNLGYPECVTRHATWAAGSCLVGQNISHRLCTPFARPQGLCGVYLCLQLGLFSEAVFLQTRIPQNLGTYCEQI